MSVKRYVLLTCDHYNCDNSDEAPKIDFLLKELGWCLSRDRKSCYCPDHAPLHRHCGKTYSSVRGAVRFSSSVVTKKATTMAPLLDDEELDAAFLRYFDENFLFDDDEEEI